MGHPQIALRRGAVTGPTFSSRPHPRHCPPGHHWSTSGNTTARGSACAGAEGECVWMKRPHPCLAALHHQPPRSARCQLRGLCQLRNFAPKVAEFPQDLLKRFDDLLVRWVLCRCHCSIITSPMTAPHGTRCHVCAQVDQSPSHDRHLGGQQAAHMCGHAQIRRVASSGAVAGDAIPPRYDRCSHSACPAAGIRCGQARERDGVKVETSITAGRSRRSNSTKSHPWRDSVWSRVTAWLGPT